MKRSMNWGKGIVMVYVAFACGTLGVVAFAMTRPVDLVSSDYYERSLHQDARRAAAGRAAALGDSFRVDLAASSHELLVTLPPSHASTAAGTITWYRPSDARADRSFPLQVDRDGRQVLPVIGLSAGHWLLRLEWTADGRSYYDERPVVIP